ncbi:MdtA/MuxA family multidrug efflux RND transporter periplasmic adaptor subunit [Bordetella petrii]|uniref:MdtA/MuxA family multidrug efflux RND transporter periplasmic adaptor subunit n=1 Tax=Bordetella petrii TaxID=94624 RepID=UPI001A96C024|nr:MdtA/MuxA family multidrug efflux RND transporter periplasmic adaptor subunit [Bordetella petrii]MBO1112059.1 MdtA/MuxA family multidrug efflux RND transporter periplasmic adaptor subunit [Bordetella petrii]
MPESRPVPPPRRTRRLVAIILLLLAAAVAAWLLFKPGGSQQPAQRGGRGFGGAAMMNLPVPVRVAQAGTQDIDIVLRALGTVTAYNTVTVRSRVDGELVRVAFNEGQRVKAGDLLAQIDPRPFEVALAQAQGQQQQNQALLANARRDLQRYQTLFKQDSIARQQLDTQAALVRQYEGTQKIDQAAVDDAKLQLGYTRITAPIEGRLGLRKVDPGNLVSAGDTDGLVVITQTQPIAVVFSLPETQLPEVLEQVRAGRTLAVQAYDRTDTQAIASGQLETIDNQIDVATGTVKLKARFDNADELLFPNQFVNVRLLVQTRADTTVIPTAAVQQGSAGAFVFLLRQDSTVEVRQVKLGAINGDRVAVNEGLAPGDKVVVEGTDRLRTGAKVNVVTGDTAIPASPGQALGAGQPASKAP